MLPGVTLPVPRPGADQLVDEAPPRCLEHRVKLARCPRCMAALLAGARPAA